MTVTEFGLQVECGQAVHLAGDPESRTIAGQLVPFGVESGPTAADGQRYVFTGPPANPDDLLDVVRGHNPEDIVGRLSAPATYSDTEGQGVARIFRTSRGDDVIEETREGVHTGFSLGVDVTKWTTRQDGVREIQEWSAQHVGIVRRPAFAGNAGTLTVKASAAPATSTTTTEPREVPPVTTTTVTELPTIAELAAQVRAELSAEAPEPSVLAEFSSRGEFLRAFFDARDSGDNDRVHALQTAYVQAQFAVADQLTTDNPGLMRPAWRTDVVLNLDANRPLIAATGGSVPIPDGGMSVHWPYLDPALDLDDIIKEQATQKTDLSGPKISILDGSANLKTAGAVSDISYQLLERGTPSYLDAYQRVMDTAWARYTENVFEDAVVAAAIDDGDLVIPTNATQLNALIGQMFAMSRGVRRATGSPANVWAASSDVFEALGAIPSLLVPTSSNPQNNSGTSDLNTLEIRVAGVQIVELPFAPDGQLVATNGTAVRFSETGARNASAEDVRKLGRDVAVWGMYVPAEIYFPNGIRKLNVAA